MTDDITEEKRGSSWSSLVVQWLRLCLPVQGLRVQSLVGELRALAAKKPKHKQKQYCNKFNKDFLNGPHKNKFFLKRGSFKIQ